MVTLSLSLADFIDHLTNTVEVFCQQIALCKT